MAQTVVQSLAHALRRALLVGLVGLLFAAALYFANPWMGFPDWAILVWPTAVMMLGLSGVSEHDATIWTVAIIGSNGLLYFLLCLSVASPTIAMRKGWRRLFYRQEPRKPGPGEH